MRGDVEENRKKVSGGKGTIIAKRGKQCIKVRSVIIQVITKLRRFLLVSSSTIVCSS